MTSCSGDKIDRIGDWEGNAALRVRADGKPIKESRAVPLIWIWLDGLQSIFIKVVGRDH